MDLEAGFLLGPAFVSDLEESTNGTLLIFVLDAKMGGLAHIGKSREDAQGDLEGIGIENCKIGTRLQVSFLCLEKNHKHERLKRNFKKGKV